MLERLVHAGTGRIPKNQQVVLIRIPTRASIEAWTEERLPPGWSADDNVASRAFADEWLQRRRSAVLIVPSAVAKYEEDTVLNPAHPDFDYEIAIAR